MKPFIKPKPAVTPAPEPAAGPERSQQFTPGELTILGVASGIADPTEREAYLDRVCGTDQALRERVEERLAQREPAPTTDGRAELVRTMPQSPAPQAVAVFPMSGMTLSNAAPQPPRQHPFPWALATLLAAGVGALAMFASSEKSARAIAETQSREATSARQAAEKEQQTAQAKELEARTTAQRAEEKRIAAERATAQADTLKAAAQAETEKARAEAAKSAASASTAGQAQQAAKAEVAKTVEAERTAKIAHADTLARFAAILIEEGRHADAEAPAQLCKTLRTDLKADVWSLCEARYLVGAALMGRGKVAEAEQELLAVIQSLEPLVPQADETQRARFNAAVKKLAQLYTATGRKKDASELRKKATPGA